ncbi:MAG: hypothetical protein GXP29_07405 [Planctomycetes bacterium]|nr:hypothetical protein [Planctomycetota bacterium]
MQKLYIKGLVKVADTVRRSVATRLSAEMKARLRQQTSDSLAHVDAILANRGATVDHLPAPTRRAYQFLSSVDFDRVVSTSPSAEHDHEQPSITLRGVTSFWEGALCQLAQPIKEPQAKEILKSISAASESIRQQLASNELQTRDLRMPSRQAHAWLTFFSVPENFDAYIAAIRIAHPILHEALTTRPGCHSNLLLEFRPMSGLYRVRGNSVATRVVLPTPMITFSEAQFEALAAAMFNGGSKQAIIEAAQAKPYQAFRVAIDAIGDAANRTAGVHHDLAASFGRVVRKYFSDAMSQPRLIWNRTVTRRKFGHYDPLTDTIMISCTLDDAGVGEFVVDFVMYHELLHKELGTDWKNGRQSVHTPEFRSREKLFELYSEAEATLSAIARQHT